jgi:hypothetical protein
VKTRRAAAIGLSVLAAGSMALSACSSKSADSATKVVTVSPQTELTNAISKLQGTGFNFTQTQGDPTGGSGVTGPGSYDQANMSATVTQKGSEDGINVELDATRVGSQLWLQLDAGAINTQLKLPSGKWMLADPAKIDPGNAPFDFSGSTDVLDIAGLMTSVSNVQQTDPTTLTGTVDLTVATGDNKPDPDDLKTAGAAAKTTPFTATVDAQGRLTELKTTSTVKDMDLDFAFADYGSPSAVTAPAAADVVPAPPALYDFLNSN